LKFQVIGNKKLTLGDINGIVQISMTVFTSVSVMFGVRQYYKNCKNEEKKFQTEYVQKAIDLSQFYKDSILTKYRAVKYVYEQTKIIDVLENIKAQDMKYFERKELEKLLNQKDFECLRSIQKSMDFRKRIIEANLIYGFNQSMQNEKELVGENCSREAVVAIFSDLVNELLCDLEFFASHFVHETADDDIVFQQLHITYLEMIHILYYSIANCNDDSIFKYYQNVTELYQRWYQKSEMKRDCVAMLCKQENQGQSIPRRNSGRCKN